MLSVKGQIKYFRLCGHIVSVPATQCCHGNSSGGQHVSESLAVFQQTPDCGLALAKVSFNFIQRSVSDI